MARYTLATACCSAARGYSSQPGMMRIIAQATPSRNSSGPIHHGRSAPSGPRPNDAYTSSCSPVTEPVLPSSLISTDTPATSTSTTTVIQPRPWITVPMVSPTAPPNMVADPTRLTRARYGPPTSTTAAISPPMAGSRPSAGLCPASPAASGTQMARAARSMSGRGGRARCGRTISTSQSGATASRTLAACRGSSFSVASPLSPKGSPRLAAGCKMTGVAWRDVPERFDRDAVRGGPDG